jgi:FkbM family methyltransferase
MIRKKMSFDIARECYLSYIKKLTTEPPLALQSAVDSLLNRDSLENPISSIDHNNLGVIALLEAESSSEAFEQSSLLALAQEYFISGLQLDSNPLCRVHLAIVYWLSGDDSNCISIAFQAFIDSLHVDFSGTLLSPPGIIYLPGNFGKQAKKIVADILIAKNAYIQSRILACDLMLSATLFFYNETGFRMLQVFQRLLPNSGFLSLKLGISLLINRRKEGLFHLHESCQLCPDEAAALHALYLAYKDAGNIKASSYWYQEACGHNSQILNKERGWKWTALPINSPFTYLPFDSILLATEASLLSIVTSVLLVDEDWVEPEIKFWRAYLKPGMVAIDIGANVGVYTFSAAARVGATGKVIAVEPTAICLKCLRETIQINDLQQVKVYDIAASDREGSVSFRVSPSSELNEVVTGNVFEEIGLITVPCLPIDIICAEENIQRLDLIKIDAEGHELSVLKGALKVLSTFRPIILYENVAGAIEANLPVYNFLKTYDYQLYRYCAFKDKLIELKSESELPGLLNVIAVPVDLVLNK